MTVKVQVNVGDEVFAQGSTAAFGAVRHVAAHELVVDIEGYGDVHLRADVVVSVHDHKVIVDTSLLGDDLKQAIEHAHDREDR